MYQPIRPQEITAWMSKSSRVGSWVAIDDRDLVREIGGAALQGHFVRTHPASGLTAPLADRAIRILQTGRGGEGPAGGVAALGRTLPPSANLVAEGSEHAFNGLAATAVRRQPAHAPQCRTPRLTRSLPSVAAVRSRRTIRRWSRSRLLREWRSTRRARLIRHQPHLAGDRGRRARHAVAEPRREHSVDLQRRDDFCCIAPPAGRVAHVAWSAHRGVLADALVAGRRFIAGTAHG